MRVLVFGSRLFDDEFIVGAVLQGFLAESQNLGESLVIIDGKARGADSFAGAFYGGAEDGLYGGIHEDVQHERYPADWDRYGDAAGPVRNQQELDDGRPDLAVGFVDGLLPDGRPNTRGSKDMFERLRKARVKTYLIPRSRW